MREIIYDPDFTRGSAFEGSSLRPRLHRCEIEHGPTLSHSDNRIVNGLIARAYAVHECVSTFYLGFPRWIESSKGSFVANVRHEFQAKLGEVGFLRFRFEVPGEVYLTLLHIYRTFQGRGHAREWFPKITDDFLQVGAKSLRGRVMPSMYAANRPMNAHVLTEFYRREAGFEVLDGGWIKKASPRSKPDSIGDHTSPKSDATETRRASERAMIS